MDKKIKVTTQRALQLHGVKWFINGICAGMIIAVVFMFISAFYYGLL